MPSHVSTPHAEQLPAHELADLKRELAEAHRRGAATAELLRVINRSRTDVQPVFDTIVRSAVRLCDELVSGLFQFDGKLLHVAAHHNFSPEALEQLHRVYPMELHRASVVRLGQSLNVRQSTYQTLRPIRSSNITRRRARLDFEAVYSFQCSERALPSASSRWGAPSPCRSRTARSNY